MKGITKINEIAKEVHTKTLHPIVALVAASAQALYSDDCEVVTGTG